MEFEINDSVNRCVCLFVFLLSTLNVVVCIVCRMAHGMLKNFTL